MNTAENAAVATETKTYDRPWMPRGQYMAWLREQGKLQPRQSQGTAKAKSTGKSKAKSAGTEANKAERSAFARRMYFVNKARAAKAAGGEQAPKEVYATPYKTRGQWFKEMREAGKLAPRQPKVAAAEVAAEAQAA